MVQVKSQTRESGAMDGALALEEAHEAISKLKTLKAFLSPKDEETLSILMDKELSTSLKISLKEVDAGEFEPLENILK